MIDIQQYGLLRSAYDDETDCFVPRNDVFFRRYSFFDGMPIVGTRNDENHPLSVILLFSMGFIPSWRLAMTSEIASSLGNDGYVKNVCD